MRHFGRIIVLVAGAAVLLSLVAPDIWSATGERNHCVHQAAALLAGRLDVTATANFEDLSVFAGRKYVAFPPLPSFLVLPLVWLFGFGTNTALIALALTALSAALLVRIAARLGVSRSSAAWLVAAFLAGSVYLPVLARAYEAWQFAQVCAVAAMLLAIDESLGRRRGWLCGLWCGLAVLSRQMSIYSAVLLLIALLQVDVAARRAGEGLLPSLPAPAAGEARRLRRAIGFLIALGLCIAAQLAWNGARFGNPLDTGYSYMPLSGFLEARVERYGLFHVAYVPFNLYQLLLAGFHVEMQPPLYLWPARMDPFGTSLMMASPFVLLALLARRPALLVVAAWASVALAAGHASLYYNNGWAQTNGQRFSLDFLPVLMVLVIAGVRCGAGGWWRWLVVYAIVLNIAALAIVPALARAMA